MNKILRLILFALFFAAHAAAAAAKNRAIGLDEQMRLLTS
jgi:hypothetical protein